MIINYTPQFGKITEIINNNIDNSLRKIRCTYTVLWNNQSVSAQ